jgi:hypothetical protein
MMLAVGAATLATAGCDRLLGIEHVYAEPDGGDRPSEADADVRGDGDAAEPFCASRDPLPTFCMDFDTVNTPEQGWTFHDLAGFSDGGTFELDRQRYITGPASLRLGVPAGNPGQVPGFVNRLEWDTGNTTTGRTSVHFECELWLDAVDPVEPTALVGLSFQDGNPVYVVTLFASRNGALLQEESAKVQVQTPLERLVPYQKWVHVDLDIRFDANPATVTVKLDGTGALTHVLMSGSHSVLSQLSIQSLYYTSKTVAATSVNFDNVLIEAK